MNDAVVGSKYFVVDGKGDQTVVPTTSGSSCWRHSKDAPPYDSSTGMPRLSRYQLPKDLASEALKKIPPIPVIFSMKVSYFNVKTVAPPRLATLDTKRSRVCARIRCASGV